MPSMLSQVPARREGVLDGEHADVIRHLRVAADELFGCLVEAEINAGGLSALNTILVALCARSLSTFYGIVDVLELALSREALILHRSLFEVMLHAWWLDQDPDERVDRYIRYDNLYRWYQATYVQQWTDEKDPDLDEEILKGLIETAVHFQVVPNDEEGRAWVRDDPSRWAQELKRTVFKGPGPGSWTGANLWKLVEEVGPSFHHGDRFESGTEYLEYLYRVVYGAASAQIHPSPRAVSESLRGTPGKSLGVEIGPNPAWTLPVASTALPFIYWTFQVLDRHESLELEARMMPVMEEFQEIFGRSGRRHDDLDSVE